MLPLKVSDEVRLMSSVCEKLKIAHRIVFTLSRVSEFSAEYVASFQVGDACDKSGLVTPKDLTALIAWISAKH